MGDGAPNNGENMGGPTPPAKPLERPVTRADFKLIPPTETPNGQINLETQTQSGEAAAAERKQVAERAERDGGNPPDELKKLKSLAGKSLEEPTVRETETIEGDDGSSEPELDENGLPMLPDDVNWEAEGHDPVSDQTAAASGQPQGEPVAPATADQAVAPNQPKRENPGGPDGPSNPNNAPANGNPDTGAGGPAPQQETKTKPDDKPKTEEQQKAEARNSVFQERISNDKKTQELLGRYKDSINKLRKDKDQHAPEIKDIKDITPEDRDNLINALQNTNGLNKQQQKDLVALRKLRGEEQADMIANGNEEATDDVIRKLAEDYSSGPGAIHSFWNNTMEFVAKFNKASIKEKRQEFIKFERLYVEKYGAKLVKHWLRDHFKIFPKKWEMSKDELKRTRDTAKNVRKLMFKAFREYFATNLVRKVGMFAIFSALSPLIIATFAGQAVKMFGKAG